MLARTRLARRLSRPAGGPAPARHLSVLPQPHLLPPYAHPLARGAPSPAFAPPYAHDVSPVPGRGLRAKLNYVLVNQPGHASSSSSSSSSAPIAEADVLPQWEATLAALRAEAARAAATVVPEVGAQQLGALLDAEMGLAHVREAGVVVVRDVVIDAEAEVWGRAIDAAEQERGGQPTYYHPAQVEARADPSVLAALARVSLALTGNAEPHVRVDAVGEIAHEAGHPLEPSTTSLRAHIATAPTSIALHPSRAAASYAQLRPFFQPLRSMLSFYSRADYLLPSNWVFTPLAVAAGAVGANAGSASTPPPLADLAHLPAPAAVLLHPGDMVLALPALPLTGPRALPLHLLATAEHVPAQRAAFERGLPPPHIAVDGELVAAEEPGSAAAIGSWAGRRAMGYE